MRINTLTNINTKSFRAGCANTEIRSLLSSVPAMVENAIENPQQDILVLTDGKDKEMVKTVNGKKVCISEFYGGGIAVQIADTQNEIVDVFYHTPNDCAGDKYCKYKDKKLFPWFLGADEKLFSKHLNNMSKSELENVKYLLKTYLPEFILQKAPKKV